MIAAIAILTIIDIVCTTVGLSLGYITEGNPLMARLFDWSVIGTCIIALLIVGLALWYVSRYMEYRWIRYALTVVVIVKVVIIGMHVNWIVQVI